MKEPTPTEVGAPLTAALSRLNETFAARMDDPDELHDYLETQVREGKAENYKAAFSQFAVVAQEVREMVAMGERDNVDPVALTDAQLSQIRAIDNGVTFAQAHRERKGRQ